MPMSNPVNPACGPEEVRGSGVRTPRGMKPLCIDLFRGLGGWTEGFLAEGWDVVGFDIERHRYPIWFLSTTGGEHAHALCAVDPLNPGLVSGSASAGRRRVQPQAEE
jgi:hypothetical protein